MSYYSGGLNMRLKMVMGKMSFRRALRCMPKLLMQANQTWNQKQQSLVIMQMIGFKLHLCLPISFFLRNLCQLLSVCAKVMRAFLLLKQLWKQLKTDHFLKTVNHLVK